MDDYKIHSNVTATSDFKLYTGDTPDWHYSPSTIQPNPEGPYTIPNQPISETPNREGLFYGWVCPKCGYVFSPNTSECPYCNGHTNTITYSTLATIKAQPSNTQATIDISQTNSNNTNTTAEFKTPNNITSGKLN